MPPKSYCATAVPAQSRAAAAAAVARRVQSMAMAAAAAGVKGEVWGTTGVGPRGGRETSGKVAAHALHRTRCVPHGPCRLTLAHYRD